jgi:transcriptional regulator with XRE-family HTH domain
MVVAKLPKEPTDFGKRVLRALEEEGRSQNSAEREAGLGKGYLSRMIFGDRGGTSVHPQHMRELAKVLHVNFEWLVVGDGPMRRGGRDTTTAEQAITFARGQGAREDAIKSAWDRNQDRATDMTATDWLMAIDGEARRLDRAGVPRPEITADKREAIARTKKQLERAIKTKEGKAVEESKPVPARRRASGGM